MVKARKCESDADFLAALKGAAVQHTLDGHGRTGMIMTKPPEGPNKSLEELLSIAEISNTVQKDEVPSVLLKQHEDSIVELNIEQIDRSRYQVRTMGNEEYIAQLAESMRLSGQISPVIVRPIVSKTEELRYEFVAGEHRALAAKRLGNTKIKCIVKALSDKDAAAALTADNSVRKDIDDLDRFKHLRMLRESNAVKTNREAAMLLKVDPTAIPQLESFGLLKDETVRLLEEASARVQKSANDLPPVKVGMSAVYAIRDLALEYPDLVHAAFIKVCNEKLPQKNIRQWVNSHFRKPVVVQARKMEIQRPDGKTIKIKVTDSGAELSFSGLNIDKLYSLLENNLDHLCEP